MKNERDLFLNIHPADDFSVSKGDGEGYVLKVLSRGEGEEDFGDKN